MKTAIALLTAAVMLITNVKAPEIAWNNLDEQERIEASTALKAAHLGLTEDEFILLSSVVEAESNRDPEDISGRVYIALTIINRVNDPRFPDTITGVLTQAGQFSTVQGGVSVCNRTNLSDAAVLSAYEWIEQGGAPEILFFNCIGYNYGEPYGCVGGNYFSTWEA